MEWGTNTERFVEIGKGEAKGIVALVMCARCSKHTLQSLAGSIVYPLMHRRELMCCLGETFTFLESMSDSIDAKIPAVVVDELLCSALAMTLAFTNIRAHVSPCLSATDATVRRAGACQAYVPQKVANGLDSCTGSHSS